MKLAYLYFLMFSLLCNNCQAITEAWKPAEMPRNAQEAAQKYNEAEIEERAVRDKLARERDPVEKAKLEAERDKLDYDLQTFETAEINFEAIDKAAKTPRTDPDYAHNQEMAQHARESLEAHQKEITEKIQAYEQAVSGGGRVVDGGGTELTPYESVVDTALAKARDEAAEIKLFTQELNMLDSGKSTLLKGQDLTDYAKRKEVLKSLLDTVRNEIQANKPGLRDIRNRIERYIQEIEAFSPRPPMPGNSLDVKLQLSYKIPRDQVRALKTELGIASFGKNFPEVTQKFQAAAQAQQAIEHYNLYDDGLNKRIHDIMADPDVVKVRIARETLEQEQLKALDDAIALASKDPDYTKRRARLQEILSKDVNPLVAKEGFRLAKEDVRERIAEIDKFLSSPQKSPMTKNAIDQELRLSHKMPTEQMQSILDRIELFGYAEDPAALGKESVAALQQMRDAMSYYGLDKEYPANAEMIDTIIDKATPKPAEQPPVAVKSDPVLEAVVETVIEPAKTSEEVQKTLMSKFLSGGKLVWDAIAKFLSHTTSSIHEGIRYGINSSGKRITHTFTAPETINKMANAPKTFDAIIDGILEFDKKGGGLYEGIARADLKAHIKIFEMITGDKELADELRAFVDGGYKDTLVGKEGAAGAKLVQKVRDVVQKIGTTGTVLKTIIELPKPLGELLDYLTRSQDETAMLRRFEEARTLIEDERARMKPVKTERSEQNPLTKMVADKVGEWAKAVGDVLKNFDGRMTKAQSDYTAARKAYLDLLGLPENASEAAIAEKLDWKAKGGRSSVEYKALTEVTEAMVNATVALTDVYKQYVQELENLQVNLEFLINAWDAIKVGPDVWDEKTGTFTKNAQFIEFVRGTFALRDMRLNTLAAMREGIRQLEGARTDLANNEVRQYHQDYSDAMQRMIDEKTFSTITSYGKAINDIEGMIQAHEAALKEKLEKEKT